MKGILAFVLITGVAAAGGLPIGSVKLGMSEDALLLVAKQKKRPLIGPGKQIVHHTAPVQVRHYTVGKDRTLGRMSGVKRQGILLLNNKVIGVEMLYNSSSSYRAFEAKMKSLGFKQEGDAWKGMHKDVETLVFTEKLRGAKKRTYMSVIVLSLQVLGKKYTLANVLKAQQAGTNHSRPGRNALDALSRTL